MATYLVDSLFQISISYYLLVSVGRMESPTHHIYPFVDGLGGLRPSWVLGGSYSWSSCQLWYQHVSCIFTYLGSPFQYAVAKKFDTKHVAVPKNTQQTVICQVFGIWGCSASFPAPLPISLAK